MPDLRRHACAAQRETAQREPEVYVQGLRDVAFELKVPLADAYAEWKELEQKGVDTTALLANGMNHPNADLHKIFADKLFTLIFEE